MRGGIVALVQATRIPGHRNIGPMIDKADRIGNISRVLRHLKILAQGEASRSFSNDICAMLWVEITLTCVEMLLSWKSNISHAISPQQFRTLPKKHRTGSVHIGVCANFMLTPRQRMVG